MSSVVEGLERDGSVAPPNEEFLVSEPDTLVGARAGDELVCPRCGTTAGEGAYCSGCGLHVAAEPKLPTRAEFRAAADNPPAKAPAAASKPISPVEGQPNERRALRVVVPIVALLAVVALAVAVAGLVVNRPKSDAGLRTQVRHLQGQLTAASQQLSSAQATISSLKASSQVGAVSTLQNQIQKLQNCVPEIEQQINGLSISTDTQSGWLTDAYINNPTIISSNCTKTLNGS